MFSNLVEFVRDSYQTNEFIPLHVPTFAGNEKEFVASTIESTFVSSVGKYVDQFERDIAAFTGSDKAVAVVNGTAALHTALLMAGVTQGDLVITQALTFVATCNAIHHMGAESLFIDVSKTSLGLCPVALENYLEQHAERNDNGDLVHKTTRQVIRAAVPMHTFGHPVELDEIATLCGKWGITLVEDAAESLGSYYKGKHTGTIGRFAAMSFNGNKVITTGGGGVVLCRNGEDGDRTKHLTTTAKVPHPYEFYHDEAGFNYRMPNLNAALGCAQLEMLPIFLQRKRELAMAYRDFFASSNLTFVIEPEYAKSNYWLNAVICPDLNVRDELLKQTNNRGVMTRPVWKLMHQLPMYKDAMRDDLNNSQWLASRLVNIPSTPILTDK